MANECVQTCIETLGEYLLANMPRLKQFLPEWPNPNETLTMPTLSIVSSEPAFTNLMPYELSKGNIVNHKSNIKYVVGHYDFKLQLDFWCGLRDERFKVLQQFFDALNKEVEPMGLSLALPDYHGVFARFDYVGYSFPDSEEASQRGEWRVKVSLLGHCKVVAEKSRAIITEPIENNLTTDDNEIIEP